MLASPLADAGDRRRAFWQRRDNKKANANQTSPPGSFFSTKIEFNVPTFRHR
jgi:hypothetical protein